ncbi:tRNA (uracil-5-)-methyltransferase TRM9 [Metarhizium album ARSEF 1941]|uniref:tRNA (Uracil-5-)-methyltransferase TRM9 n=1 Tax=Metarhizium album (strain ARSEF 1941) TaxID=1081103 RepID=A0A0B2X0C0_METAS|nr:tRNA (uracil-5-)-methyltransferase TRM9 [Metarhizium album ARSEF 1941]KHO01987.1 tRNA (uracil-5-)-methyltransferase TRM9 [Metarhizium album ARSEF 1941]
MPSSPSSPPPPPPPSSASASASYEQTHVHAVYEAIAPHFSATRHKPWPLVQRFLTALPPGSIGLDVGCGNGKYVPVNPALHVLACDRSPSLARLARAERAAEVLTAECLALPYRPASVDFAICIAVVHHLSTRARRRAALAQILRCLAPHGRALVYAWALEQRSSRRGWDESSRQDTLVPWVTRRGGPGPDETHHRYYHLFREGELEEDVVAAGGHVRDGGYERDNWWVVFGHPPSRDKE